jgi:hypothetical protein
VLRECVLSSQSATAVVAKEQSRVELDRCKVRNARKSGVLIEHAQGVLTGCELANNGYSGLQVAGGRGPGQTTAENCEFVRNGINGVEVGGSSEPVLRKCKVVGSRECGVLAFKSGAVRVEDCEVLESANAGIGVAGGGRAVVLRTTVRGSGAFAVHVHEGSAQVEHSDLTGNRKGAWSVNAGCTVQSTDNRE